MLNSRLTEKTNRWPGFVDLFSNLVMILIFLLIVFVFLWTTTNVFNKGGTKKIEELKRSNEVQAGTIAQMSEDEREAKDLLIMAKSEIETLQSDVGKLTEQLQEKDISSKDMIAGYESRISELESNKSSMQAIIDSLNQELSTAKSDDEKKNLQAEIESLTQKISDLQALLDSSEEKARQQDIQYTELSQRLNKALADKVAELNKVAGFQSEFYKAIKLALGDRTTIRQEGDRFIISSDILFGSGQYKLSPEGKKQLQLIANVIKDLENKIPSSINWIIRVDGHTDKVKVVSNNRAFKNNTELSLLRATAVADTLSYFGVSKRRLIPSGFGEMYPVELGNTQKELQKNRRIELRLTNR